MSKKECCYGELMKPIDNEVSGNILGRAVADSSFPNRYGLNSTDDNGSKPSGQQECKERARLHIGNQLVVGIVDGIEVVVDALVGVLHIVKPYIHVHIVVSLISQDGWCWDPIVLAVDQVQADRHVVGANLNYRNWAEQEWTEEHEHVDHHDDDYLQN